MGRSSKQGDHIKNQENMKKPLLQGGGLRSVRVKQGDLQFLNKE